MYRIEILAQADKDIRSYQKAGNIAAFKKIQDIVKELRIHPRSGTVKPEQLKYELMEYWSWRIDKKNRMIYRIEDEKTVVVVVSALGHY